MAGSRGGTVRNALERVIQTPEVQAPAQQPPPLAPAPLPAPVPVPTHTTKEDESLSLDEQLAKLGLGAVGEFFDVVLVRTKNIPRPGDITALAADGADREELLTYPDEDDPGSIWIIEDPKGYRAALLGPKIAQTYEGRMQRSEPGFIGIRSLTHTALKTTKDLRSNLHQGRPSDGYLLVTTHGNRAIGAVIDTEKLARILRLPRVKIRTS